MSPLKFALVILLFHIGIYLFLVGIALAKICKYFRQGSLSSEEWALLVLGGGAALYLLITTSPQYLQDVYNFWRFGRAYLRETTCRVEALTGGYPLAFVGTKSVHCADGSRYEVLFNRRFVRMLEPGKTYRLFFVPRTKVIVEILPAIDT